MEKQTDPTARFSLRWSAEEDEALVKLMLAEDPKDLFYHRVARIVPKFLELFPDSHPKGGVTSRCETLKRKGVFTEAAIAAAKAEGVTVLEESEPAAPVVAADAAQETPPPEQRPASGPVEHTLPNEEDFDPNDWYSHDHHRLGLDVNRIYEARVIKVHDNGVYIGLMHNGRRIGGFVHVNHIWAYGHVSVPSYHFRPGDPVRAWYMGNNLKGNLFSMVRAGFVPPPSRYSPQKAPLTLPEPPKRGPEAVADLTGFDKVRSFYELRLHRLTQADREGLKAQYDKLLGLALPAEEWLMDAITWLSNKHKEKQTISYLIGMLKVWEKTGKYVHMIPELEIVMDYFQEETGVEPSPAATKVLLRLLNLFGAAQMARAVSKFSPKPIVPDVSLMYAEELETWAQAHLRKEQSERD